MCMCVCLCVWVCERCLASGARIIGVCEVPDVGFCKNSIFLSEPSLQFLMVNQFKEILSQHFCSTAIISSMINKKALNAKVFLV